MSKQHEIGFWVMERNADIHAVAVRAVGALVVFGRDELGEPQVMTSGREVGLAEFGGRLANFSAEEFGTGSAIVGDLRCVSAWRPDVVISLVITTADPISKSLQRIARRSVERFFGKRPPRSAGQDMVRVPAALRGA